MQPIEDAPEAADILGPWTVRTQLCEVPAKNPDHVSYLQVGAAHGSGRIVTADYLCHDRVDFSFLDFVVGKELFSEKSMYLFDLAPRDRRRDLIEAVGDLADALDLRPQKAVRFAELPTEVSRGRTRFTGLAIPESAQGVQNDDHIDYFLEEGARDGH